MKKKGPVMSSKIIRNDSFIKSFYLSCLVSEIMKLRKSKSEPIWEST